VSILHDARVRGTKKGRGVPSVLLDARPLQGPSSHRGIGSYARGLIGGLISEGFDSNLTLLLNIDLPEPELPKGSYALAGARRRYQGQLSAYEDAVGLNADLKRIGKDVYHAIDLRLPGAPPYPMVVTLHDLIPWAWKDRSMRGEQLRFWLGRRLLKRADAVLAVSQATADDAVRLAGIAPARIQVVPEAADPVFKPKDGAAERVRSRWGLGPGFLIHVGALDVRKDPNSLWLAWATARSLMPDLELVLAGSPGKQAPQGLAGARPLGHVTVDELADLYAVAGCLVFASRYEGFGLTPLEAMACGCPVAAFRNSSVPEVVGDAGALVDDGDAEALGRAAAAQIADPGPARLAGLRRAKTFSWPKTARRTIAAYEALLR